MSEICGSSYRSRSSSPSNGYYKRSMLSKISDSELKLIRVKYRRNDVSGPVSNLPLERNIDNPAKICAYVHLRKDSRKLPRPPVFGKGIKVDQEFSEKKRSRDERSESRIKTRSRSRSIRRLTSESRNKYSERNRSASREKGRYNKYSEQRSKSRTSRSRSASRERRNDRRVKHSPEVRRARSPYNRRSLSYDSDCPVHGNHVKKSLTPLRPGEYRPGHPDLALRKNKRQRSRSRSLSREYDRKRRKSSSRDARDIPSTSRQMPCAVHSRRSKSPIIKSRSPLRQSRSDRDRSPRRSDRYRRSRSPSKRFSKSEKSRSPRRHSRSPRYTGSSNMPMEYAGYYEGWIPGPRFPPGRGRFPMQPFYPPDFYPRVPGPVMMPRMSIMGPFVPYGPRYPIYNSGAIRQRPPKAPEEPKPATVTSDKEEAASPKVGVVITEVPGDKTKEESDFSEGQNVNGQEK